MDDFDDDESPRRKKDETPLTEEGAPEPSEANTLHIPNAFLQGSEFKPGDQVMMKVIAVGDDGVEVAYATEDDSGEEMSAEAELDSINDGY